MKKLTRAVASCLAICLSVGTALITGASTLKGEPLVAHEPEALRAVISDPRLQGFLHPEIAERFPMQVILPDGVPAEAFAGLDVGVPADFLGAGGTPDPDKARLDVTTLDLAGSEPTVAFTFPIEGLSGTALLSRTDGAWRVTRLDLAER